MSRNLTRALVATFAVAVAACGGGGGGSPTAGIDGTGNRVQDAFAVGTVTGFGSVFVNGVRFDTSSTRFVIDGNPGTQDDLAVGDVVVVRGTLSTTDSSSGTATEIVFDDVVEGPISAGSLDALAGTFVVLGQTIRVTADTSFDDRIQPASVAGLADGDIVEISGFRQSDGSVQATRIEPKAPGQEFEVTGFVTNLNGAVFSFEIGGLTVDYSAAMVEDFAGGLVAEGDLVEVKGTTLGGAGELIATRVEFKGNDFQGDDGDHAELEGFVTRFASVSDFDVAGAPVTTTAQTRYEGGTAADLGLDVKVEVEGALNAAGVLVATEVDIRRASAVRVLAVIDSVDRPGDAFVVLGITVATDALTRIEDKSSRDVEPFRVDDLFIGDYVEVSGSELPAGSGRILASRVERENLDTRTELQGFVTAENGGEIVILGVTVSTQGSTQYRDAENTPISASTFFSRIAVGSLVKVYGTESGTTSIAASELQIEIE